MEKVNKTFNINSQISQEYSKALSKQKNAYAKIDGMIIENLKQKIKQKSIFESQLPKEIEDNEKALSFYEQENLQEVIQKWFFWANWEGYAGITYNGYNFNILRKNEITYLNFKPNNPRDIKYISFRSGVITDQNGIQQGQKITTFLKYIDFVKGETIIYRKDEIKNNLVLNFNDKEISKKIEKEIEEISNETPENQWEKMEGLDEIPVIIKYSSMEEELFNLGFEDKNNNTISIYKTIIKDVLVRKFLNSGTFILQADPTSNTNFSKNRNQNNAVLEQKNNDLFEDANELNSGIIKTLQGEPGSFNVANMNQETQQSLLMINWLENKLEELIELPTQMKGTKTAKSFQSNDFENILQNSLNDIITKNKLLINLKDIKRVHNMINQIKQKNILPTKLSINFISSLDIFKEMKGIQEKIVEEVGVANENNNIIQE